MDERLVKFLLGEASEDEEKETRAWINENPANQRHFNHIQKIWEESKRLESDAVIDEHKAWQKFQRRIYPNDHILPLTPHTRNSWKITTAVAVALLAGIFIFYFFQANSQLVIIAAGNRVRIDTLPDGSVVTLNKNATISFPRRFKEHKRNVELTGEAFFQVAPDKKKPFAIQTGAVSIQVVGTSFNVKQTTDITEVIVETGIVEVEKKSNLVRLLPHEKAIVYKEHAAPMVEKNKDELYNYYRTREFICNSTPLWKLVEVLNEAYGTHIIILNKDIRNLTLTTTFKQVPLQEILDILSQTLDIEQTKNNGSILLK